MTNYGLPRLSTFIPQSMENINSQWPTIYLPSVRSSIATIWRITCLPEWLEKYGGECIISPHNIQVLQGYRVCQSNGLGVKNIQGVPKCTGCLKNVQGVQKKYRVSKKCTGCPKNI